MEDEEIQAVLASCLAEAENGLTDTQLANNTKNKILREIHGLTDERIREIRKKMVQGGDVEGENKPTNIKIWKLRKKSESGKK